jgi:hypothetical protein
MYMAIELALKCEVREAKREREREREKEKEGTITVYMDSKPNVIMRGGFEVDASRTAQRGRAR